ncbi:MAG: hypothetical protein WBN94_08015 [Methanothrix sp.]
MKMPVPPIISGEKVPDDVSQKILDEETEEKKFWNSVAQDIERGKVSRHLDGAKQIINLNGVLLGVYFASISFGSLDEHLTIRSFWDVRWIVLVLLPAIVWAWGLWIAVHALEPNPYPYKTNDPGLTKKRWGDECTNLSQCVWKARLSLVIGFICMIFSFSIYLYYMCDP